MDCLDIDEHDWINYYILWVFNSNSSTFYLLVSWHVIFAVALQFPFHETLEINSCDATVYTLFFLYYFLLFFFLFFLFLISFIRLP